MGVCLFFLFSSKRGPRADPRSRFFSRAPRQERLHSLEHALASERVPKRSDTAAGAGGSGGSDKSNAFVRSGGGSGNAYFVNGRGGAARTAWTCW